jgi:hypothetical protein
MVEKGKLEGVLRQMVKERATSDRRCKRSKSTVLTMTVVFRRLSTNVDNCG